MTPSRQCTQCGADLPPDAPSGICVACALRLGLTPAEPSGQHELDSAALVKTVAISESQILDRLVEPPVLPGERVRYMGDYELLEEIARGGMGVVYRARQMSLNRTVALKMILAGELAGPEEVTRFRREAEAAAHLQHPNIVAIHEIGEHGGLQYFSMDLVEGRSLAEEIRSGPMAVGEAVTLLRKVAEAIHFAHQRGVIHRDLKPSNILLDQQGQPRVTDFGLAKKFRSEERFTETGLVMGTPAYMAPEQAAGRHDLVGPLADVYALGAILYATLTGQQPFPATTAFEAMHHVLETPARAPSRLNPRVPPELDAICLKCLEKRPEGRYASALDLAADLGRFLDREPILARPAGKVQRTLKWLERHPAQVAGAMAALLLLMIWFLYALWMENRVLSWEKENSTQVFPATASQNLVTGLFLRHPWINIALPSLVAGLAASFRLHRGQRILTGRRMSAGLLAVHAFLAGIGIMGAVWLGTQGIRQYHWSRHALTLGVATQTTALAGDSSRSSTRSDVRTHVVTDGAFLFGTLACSCCVVIGGAMLLVMAWREHNFAFYLSQGEEHAARDKVVEQRKFKVVSRGGPRAAIAYASFLSLLGLAGLVLTTPGLQARLTLLVCGLAAWGVSAALGRKLAEGGAHAGRRALYALAAGFVTTVVFAGFRHGFLSAAMLLLLGFAGSVLGWGLFKLRHDKL